MSALHPSPDTHDLFICHASEDKSDVARPLAGHLRAAGLTVWYDEFSLKLGDSLRASIDRGLASSRFGVVILSPSFFAKKWPQAELNGLFAKEMAAEKTILPIWHKIKHAELLNFSPILADRIAASTDQGLDTVLQRILDAVDSTKVHKAVKGHALALSHSTIRLHTGGWEVQTPVAVTNLGALPVYTVMLQLLIDGVGVSADSLQLDTEPMNPEVEISIGDVTMSADAAQVSGIHKDGRQTLLFTFHTVPAKSTRTLLVKGSVPIESSAQISLARFDLEPPELIRKDGSQVAMKLQPPCDMVVHGMRLRLRRNTP